nr:hypothetical protein [Tanacetum cinerariifolium]
MEANAFTEPTKGPMSADNTTEPISFATLLKGELSRKHVNFYTFLAQAHNGGDVFISKELWSPDTNIKKEDMCNEPVWDKFHDILITAFMKDVLSAIATKLGSPLILNSYTTDIYLESWGRLSYARAMIESRADVELKDTLVVDIPKFEGKGHCSNTMEANAFTEPTKGPMSADNTTEPISFATLLKGELSRKHVNFYTFLAQAHNGGDVFISKELWSPDTNIKKEDMCNEPVWDKFHDILITAFMKDVLSAIATKLGSPLILNSYTTDIYLESWGRLSYARAMIESRADVELKDTLVVDIPKFEGKGYTRRTIHVEYEWKPPKSSTCKVFGHVMDECPKKIVLICIKEFKDAKTSCSLTSGTNEGNSKLAEKGAISNVVASTHATTSEALGSPSITPLAKRINYLNRSMLDEKFVLVDDDGKPLNNVDDPGNTNSDNEVEEVFNKNTGFMASTSSKVDNSSKNGSGVGNKSMYECVNQLKMVFENLKGCLGQAALTKVNAV